MNKLTDFSKLVAKTRKAWGMSFEQMAVELGTSYHSVHAWETGKRNPPAGFQKLLIARFEMGKKK